MMRELTPQEIARLGGFLLVGKPSPKLLWEWVQPVAESDLDTFMSPAPEKLIRQTPDWTSPLEVRNWVARHTAYVHDLKQYGVPEHWPDPGQVIEFQGDDCDGLGLFTASILFSVGVRGIRPTIGTYDGGGHLWVEWHIPQTSTSYLIETTGDAATVKLPRFGIDNETKHYTSRMQAERTGPHSGRIWVDEELYNKWQAVNLI